MSAALVGIVAIVPYTITLLGSLPVSVDNQPPPLWVLLSLQLAEGVVLVGAATALGLWLGPKVGLGAPLVHGLLAGDRSARTRLRASVGPAALVGVLVGAAIVGLDLWVFSARLPAPSNALGTVEPPPWQGLLAALYGGIAEELMLRLGVMTFLVWLGARLTRTVVPGPTVLWTAILLTAVLFGVGHLPVTAALWPLTPLVIACALLLNGLGGIAFGWLYWKQGLIAAMLAHFSADIVLHTVAPLLNH
jgi:membrane protease YdiL (CAAX protease family)